MTDETTSTVAADTCADCAAPEAVVEAPAAEATPVVETPVEAPVAEVAPEVAA